jgi:2-dehydropantoate 2-reductase
MKHAILGAGAIGGLMATVLDVIGENVTLIVRAEKVENYPPTLTLTTPSGTLTARANVIARLMEPVDVLWIATKTYQLEDALSVVEVKPGIVVPLLNGVDHVPELRAHFGKERVVPATIAVGADRTAPGQFAQHSMVRLNVATSGEALLKDIIERLKSRVGFNCEFVASEPTLLWGKLCFLEPLALVTSASGKNLGEVLGDPEWKGRAESVFREAAAVAAREGAQIDVEKILAGLPAWPPTTRASMAKDLAAGRRLELDGIAGPIVRGGVKYGVPTPVTTGLIAMIEEKLRLQAQ